MLSEKVKSFLLENNIYNIEELKKLSIQYLVTLKGFSFVKKELLNIFYSSNTYGDNQIEESIKSNIGLITTSTDSSKDRSNLKSKIGKDKKPPPDNVGNSFLTKKDELIEFFIELKNYVSYLSQIEELFRNKNDQINPILDYLSYLEVNGSLRVLKFNLDDDHLYFLNEIGRLAKNDKDHDYQYDNLYLYETEEEFKVPDNLKELSIDSIKLFFYYIELKNNYGALKRINHNFIKLKDLDGHSIESLFEIKNIGKTVINIISQWFSYFDNGSFTNLAKKYTMHYNSNIKDIICSPFLKSFLYEKNIFDLNQISKLDHQLDNISQLDNLCLIELRTLSYISEKLTTTSNCIGPKINLIRWIDEFTGKYCSEYYKAYILNKWNFGNKTLNEVGIDLGVTRERVRQIIRVNIKKLFIDFYIYDIEFYNKYFLKKLHKKLKPLELNNLNTEDYEPIYNESFYLGFINNIFPYVPLKGFNPKTYHTKRRVVEELFDLSKIPNTLKLYSYLSTKSVEYQLDVYSVIFTSKYYIGRDGKVKTDNRTIDIIKHNNKIYLNPQSVSLMSSILSILEEHDRPIGLDEMCLFLKEAYFYQKEVNRNSVYNTFNRLDDTVILEWRVWGLKRHFSYPNEDWELIQNECIKYLNNLGHQAGAKFIYDAIKDKYPKLISKYELVHLLRASDNIIDLGFFNFVTDSMKVEERLQVADIINDIFNKNKLPKSRKQIFELITSLRTARPEGMHHTILQIGTFKYYRPSHYGLKNRHNKNISELLKNKYYFMKFIKYDSPYTNIEYISNYFETDENKILERINSIEGLDILQDDYSNNHYAIDSNWTPKRQIKTIIFNNSEPLTVPEVKWNLNTLGINLTNKQITGVIREDLSYAKSDSGTYTYLDLTVMSDELIELMFQVEDYLLSLDQTIEIYELYNLVSDMTSDLKNKNHLIKLLTLNNKVIIHNNMVGIFDDN